MGSSVPAARWGTIGRLHEVAFDPRIRGEDLVRLEATIPDSRGKAIIELAEVLGLSRSQVIKELAKVRSLVDAPPGPTAREFGIQRALPAESVEVRRRFRRRASPSRIKTMRCVMTVRATADHCSYQRRSSVVSGVGCKGAAPARRRSQPRW